MFNHRKLILLLTLGIAIIALYLYHLDGVGVIGPDEPRYAAIGRAMAHSDDFITPVLWGKPWFEKPPLLYWMTAAGTSIGLGPDLCGRLPVALLSLSFLGALLVWSSREFGSLAGAVTTTALATSAGWLTYSSFCLTDLPLAVTFSGAVFLACPLLRPQPVNHVRTRFVFLGVFIGLGMLAKGLVPVALAVPFCWFLRAYVRHWWLAVAGCLTVAAPWYGLAYQRNGYAFIDSFFIKQQVQRLYSAALLHTQPWYYYIPVLLVGLFPWMPLFGILLLRPRPWDRRRQFLLAVSAAGFLFFSVTRNKLPHYLLPILPSLFVLLGSWFEGTGPQSRSPAGVPRGWLAASALLIGTIPMIAVILPRLLAAGRFSIMSSLHPITLMECAFMALPVAATLLVPRPLSFLVLVSCAIIGMFYLKVVSYPAIDELVSPRDFWLANSSRLQTACNGGTNRDWLYGLSYYRGQDFPECQTGSFRYVMRTVGKGAPVITPLPAAH